MKKRLEKIPDEEIADLIREVEEGRIEKLFFDASAIVKSFKKGEVKALEEGATS